MNRANEEKLLCILERMNESAEAMSKSIQGLMEIAKILDRRLTKLEEKLND